MEEEFSDDALAVLETILSIQLKPIS